MIYEEGLEHIEEGELADYIPELTLVDKNKAGIAVIDENGLHSYGDTAIRFTIQSIVKIPIYIKAMVDGVDLYKYTDITSSAMSFNSITDLTLNDGKPRNPVVNAGAISLVGALYEIYGEDTYTQILTLIEDLIGRSATYSQDVYLSEYTTAYKNQAIINYMATKGIVDINHIDEILRTYLKLCAICVDTIDLVKLGYIISRDFEDTYIPENMGTKVRTVMAMCGMYNNSAQFGMEVGLPAKSGVGGGVMAASRNIAVATYSPGLNRFGNSHVGTYMLKRLSEELDLTIF